MNRRFKFILLVLIAGAVISAPFIHHLKNAISTDFPAEHLPKDKDVNLFELGKIDSEVDLKNIKGLSEDESLVLFKFTTEDGDDVSLLMRRTIFHGKRKDALKLAESDEVAQQFDKDHVVKIKNRIKNFIGNAKELPITAWYRFDPNGGEWHQLYTVLDRKDEYRFASGFNVRIFPNGLVAFHAEGQKPVIVSATGSPARVSEDGKRIAVGKNKDISAADMLKHFGKVKVHAKDSEELP